MAVALVLTVFSPEGGAGAAQNLLGGAAQLALLDYTRDAERQADADALAASLALYGHAGGVTTLFSTLPQGDGPAETVWLRSHPDTAERLAAAQAAAAARGAALKGPATPLPGALRALPTAAARRP
jgi:beta-barrel assembly-enhancing protease